MDRCSTLTWGASLQNLDLNVSDLGSGSSTGVSAGNTTFRFAAELQVLRLCLGRLFDECGDQALDMDKVTREILGWYHVNSERAFAQMDSPSEEDLLAKKLFDSLGHVKASRAKVRNEEQSLHSRIANADVAVQRALDKLAESGMEPATEAYNQLESKLNTWKTKQREACETFVAAAQRQESEATRQLEMDIIALVERMKTNHALKKSMPATSEEMWDAVMQQVEQDMEMLTMGAGSPTHGETGGTDANMCLGKGSPAMDEQNPGPQHLPQAPDTRGAPPVDVQNPSPQQLPQAPDMKGAPPVDGQNPSIQQLPQAPDTKGAPSVDGQNPSPQQLPQALTNPQQYGSSTMPTVLQLH